ncbi:hypothetical protein IVB22_25470 [Bradyrhizobium sp. 190]|uniref:PIN domain-containing protein n=1 Tax=Bradyrhizobium sp. 190 TaxID=2782658 RepID=UPI001FFB57B8|nr:PIN domain-containing protein [Bradyrhizobium sp. 190]MCK1515847.1 hypothetical protein [Bradyrhizobium sp. 190]
MPPEIETLYADTNAFLQVRDLKDIPWRDMFHDVRAVDVMVAPRVIEELDKHKSGTNQRRRDRARAALQLIDRAAREADLAIVVREEPVRVRIVISAAPRFDWASHSVLDPAKPDDQLVAEALSCGNGAAVFSHDSGPRIRARIAGLESYEPLPEWMLPIEQTDEQRRVTSLERDLRRALSNSPTIIAAFENYDESTAEVRAIIPVLQQLEREKIEQLSNEYLAKHPRASLYTGPRGLAHQLSGHFAGVSESQAERYNEDYNKFQSNVRAHFANLHKQVRKMGASVAIRYFVENDSGVSAKGLRVEFDLEGNGTLLADRTHHLLGHKKSRMPEPPAKPRSILDQFEKYSHFPNLPDLGSPRDPVHFYWYDRPNIGGKHSALQCQDFRATRKFRDSIFVMSFDNLPTTMSIRLHVSAENLPAPIDILAKLNIVEKAVDWSDEIVRDILKDDEE